jgi:hypothetical protein
MQADPDGNMLKSGLTVEIFAGHFLPAFNARLRLTVLY